MIAFFGKPQNVATYNLAKKYSGYDYKDDLNILKQKDLTDIKGLIQSLHIHYINLEIVLMKIKKIYTKIY